MNNHLSGGALHELAPLFAVDALEPAERSAFEEHLGGCARCRAELADFAEVSAHLAAGTAQEPPAGLRSSVLGAIHGTRPQTVPGTEEDRLSPEAPVPQPPTPLHPRRRRPLMLAAAAAALLLPAAGLAGWALGAQFEQRQQQEAASQEQQRQDRLLAAPDLSVQQLEVQGQPATLLFSEEQDSALFVAEGLPDPGADREYQLWLLEDGTPVPDVHFAGGEIQVWLTGEVSRAGTVALTVEPAGGSTTPTFPLVAAADLAGTS